MVCGLSNQAIQKRLLSEPDPSLEKVMEIAQSMEAADANARALHKAPEPVALVDEGTPSLETRPSPSSTRACSVSYNTRGSIFGWRRPGTFYHVMRAATYVE